MPQLSLIHEMIAAMSPAQIRFVRARIRGKKKQLFDTISLKKSASPAEIFPQLSTHAIYKLQRELQSQIAQALHAYQTKDSPYAELTDLIAEIKGYIYIGQYKEANAQLDRALKMADRLEEYGQALELLTIQKDLTLQKIHNTPPLEASLVYEETNWLRKSGIETDLSSYIKQIEEIKQLDQPSRKSWAAKTLEHLPFIETLEDTKSKILALHVKLYCLWTIRRLEEIMLEIAPLWKWLEEKPFLLSKPKLQSSLFSVLQAGLGYSIHQRSFQVAEELISKGTSCFEKAKVATPSYMASLTRWLIFEKETMVLGKADWIQEVLKLEKEWNDIQDIHYINTLLWRRIAVECFLRKELELTLKWTTLVLSQKRSNVSSNQILMASIIEIAAYCLLEEWEEMMKSIRRVEYFGRSRQCFNHTDSIILAAFRRIYSDSTELKRYLRSLAQELTASLVSGELEPRHLFLLGWLKKASEDKD